jgi:hypothetical protein
MTEIQNLKRPAAAAHGFQGIPPDKVGYVSVI